MKFLVMQIVNMPDGGGAEFLARTINRKCKDTRFDSISVFFNNPRKTLLKDNEFQLGNSFVYNPINFFKLFFFILKKSRKYQKVILHGHLTYALYFLIPLSYFPKFVLFYTEHNSTNGRRSFPFLRPFEKFVYSRYSKVISISPFVENKLINWLGINKENLNNDKFLVIFNGTNLYPFLERKFNKQKFNFLSIGSLSTQKGFDLTINAVNRLRDNVQNYFILGEGPKRNDLNKLISKLKLNEIVKLEGFSDPKPYLSKCDIGLIPSKWEGFGLVSIEMVSSGMPLLISNARGMSDLFSKIETVKIIEDRDISIWCAEIKNLIKNINEYEKKLEISSKSVAKFSIEKMVNNYKKEYLYFFNLNENPS